MNVKRFKISGIMLVCALFSAFIMSCATAQIAEEAGAESVKQVTGTALSVKQQKIASIAAFTANGDTENLKRVIDDGLEAGLTVNEVGEILLQIYAYAGFPRSLNGVSILTEVLEERQAAGKRDSFGVEPEFLPENIDKYATGVANLGALIGFPLQQQKAETNGYNEAMDAFLKEHLFADIFGRNNMPFDMRELATVGALSSLEGTNSQMMFHMNSLMTTGLTEEQVLNLIEVVTVELGTERGDNAKEVFDMVMARRNGAAGAPPAGNAGGYTYIPELFPVGQINDNTQIFTGNARVAPLVPFDSGSVPIVNVTFEPGARTTWHAHSYVQVLLVTLGQGFYQAEGEEPQELKAGDSIVIPAGEKHWHGSAPGEWFSHIAVIVPVESGAEDQWLEPVSEDEYLNLQ